MGFIPEKQSCEVCESHEDMYANSPMVKSLAESMEEVADQVALQVLDRAAAAPTHSVQFTLDASTGELSDWSVPPLPKQPEVVFAREYLCSLPEKTEEERVAFRLALASEVARERYDRDVCGWVDGRFPHPAAWRASLVNTSAARRKLQHDAAGINPGVLSKALRSVRQLSFKEQVDTLEHIDRAQQDPLAAALRNVQPFFDEETMEALAEATRRRLAEPGLPRGLLDVEGD